MRLTMCMKKGCGRQTFMDTNYCFDHQFVKHTKRVGAAFIVWLAFCAVVGLVVLGVGIWAVIEIVQWLKTQ